MTLVDSSVWIDHFRRGVPDLKDLLNRGRVLMHPAIIGELACGNLSSRADILRDLHRLPVAQVADAEETLYLIESRKLWGQGIGWTDALIVTSALMSACEFWTLDRRLQAVAHRLNIAAPH